jgi:hypothetical protein
MAEITEVSRLEALEKAKELFGQLKGPGGWVANKLMPRMQGYKQTDFLPSGHTLSSDAQAQLNELYRLNLARLMSNTVNIGTTAAGVGALGSLLMNTGKVKDIASNAMNPVPKNVKLVRRKKKKKNPQEKQADSDQPGYGAVALAALGQLGRGAVDKGSNLIESVISSRNADAAATTPTNLLDKGFGPLPAGVLPYLAIPTAALGGAALAAKGTNDLLTGVRARQQAKRKKELQRQYALLMNLSPEELSAVRRLSKGEKRACDLSLAINEAVELSKTASVKGHVIGGLSLASLASLLLALKSGQHLREAVGHEKAKKEAVKSLLNTPPKADPEKLPVEFFSGKSKRSPVKIVGPLGEEFDVAEPEQESDYDPALDLLKAGKAGDAAAQANGFAAGAESGNFLGRLASGGKRFIEGAANAGRTAGRINTALSNPDVANLIDNAPAYAKRVSDLEGQMGAWQGAFKKYFKFDPTNMDPTAIDAKVKALHETMTQARQTMGQAGQLMEGAKKWGPLVAGGLGLAGLTALMWPRQQPQQIVQQAPQQKAPWTEYV